MEPRTYRVIWENRETVLRGYRITIISTVVGTIVHVLLAVLAAYPLTVKRLPGKRMVIFYLLFAMLFSGGLVPEYIMWSVNLHIKNTLFAYIIPDLLLNVYHIFLVKAYLETMVPGDLYDAAKIDGMGHWGIFREIVLPMAKPVLSVIAVFVGLQYWNDWINGLYYISRSSMFSMQMILDWIVQLGWNKYYLNLTYFSYFLMRMAIAVVGMLPILAAYPFLFRPIVSSVTLGKTKKSV